MMNGTQTLNQTQFLSIDIIIALGTIVTAIILGVTLYLQIQDRKPKFTYERLKEGEIWKLMILHPDKIIHKISITIDDQPIPLANTKDRYYRTMRVSEGQNFDVGKEPNENSLVVIKYDKNKIQQKWRDIPLYHNSGF